jgi:rare lipoprotein A
MVIVLRNIGKICIIAATIILLHACSAVPRFTSSTTTQRKNTEENRKNTEETKKTENRNQLKNDGAYKMAEEGIASYYADAFHGNTTANGETFDMYKFTAAHRTLPLGTKVRVKNLDNGRSIILRINDRGPYIEGRLIDVSYAVAKQLGIVESGTAHVRVEVLQLGDNEYKK